MSLIAALRLLKERTLAVCVAPWLHLKPGSWMATGLTSAVLKGFRCFPSFPSFHWTHWHDSGWVWRNYRSHNIGRCLRREAWLNSSLRISISCPYQLLYQMKPKLHAGKDCGWDLWSGRGEGSSGTATEPIKNPAVNRRTPVTFSLISSYFNTYECCSTYVQTVLLDSLKFLIFLN